MPLVPFGSYAPDVSDYEGQTTRNILNVVPRADGYGPFQGFTSYSQALPGTCRGGFYALKSDGTIAVFAATATDLYLLDNTTFAWTLVSQSGGYTSLSPTAQWQFVQFNDFVVAVQGNANPQVFTLSSSSAFSDLAGSPPQAAYASIVGRFIVLSGLTSNPTRIQWSGLNDVNGSNSWTPGINSSDYQDLPDGGIVRGVAGGEFGTIFQDQSIRTMVYLPGSPLVFQIERVTQDMGLYAPYSIVRAGDTIFFRSAKGFYRIDPGSLPVQIGQERIDRTFYDDLDKSNLQLFVGASDPRSTRVFWAYKSVNGNLDKYDTLLGYDKTLDRFFKVAVSGEYLLGMSQSGLTLEALDAISTNIDSMTTPWDNYAKSVTPEISQIDGSHVLGFFRGSNLEAILETAEQGTDGKRIRIKGARPITDAAVVYGSASYREKLSDSPAYLDEILVNSRTGVCDMLRSTRYTRLRQRIPAGTQWSYSAGYEPDFALEGKL